MLRTAAKSTTLWLMLLSVLALSPACTKRVTIFETEKGRCEFEGNATPERLLLHCGLPDGLRWQPKTGRLWSLELCSAPAYVYGSVAVAFGCDGEYSALLDPREVLVESIDDLLLAAKKGPHSAAAIAELRNHQYSAVDRDRVIAGVRLAVDNTNPEVRRSAERTLAALAVPQ